MEQYPGFKNARENKESELPITAETVSREEFLELVYGGGSFPDKRFLPVKEGGAFEYLDLSRNELSFFLNKTKVFYSVVKCEDEVVGLAELQQNPYEEKVYWIQFVSVDPKYRDKGYGSKLIREVFRFAKEKGIILEASAYSPSGYEKLKPLQKRLAEEMGVEFRDMERRIFPSNADKQSSL